MLLLLLQQYEWWEWEWWLIIPATLPIQSIHQLLIKIILDDISHSSIFFTLSRSVSTPKPAVSKWRLLRTHWTRVPYKRAPISSQPLWWVSKSKTPWPCCDWTTCTWNPFKSRTWNSCRAITCRGPLVGSPEWMERRGLPLKMPRGPALWLPINGFICWAVLPICAWRGMPFAIWFWERRRGKCTTICAVSPSVWVNGIEEEEEAVSHARRSIIHHNKEYS